ncbi:nucleoside triphosphate pyrophosphohydrolase family protein [Shewanella sp. NFH-SH190041]|uniref:nucleoside triphosphate pyrophosphohydrolase family protein n=1 Tax=Shewanella sp. NFH-SH190041 TaxID=2950245 RepID=UPI0021C4B035|nr:nucleoside triphosphate pyrophosphohydrolase family protein [Shewanella sp. NFH-SH190041]
MKLTSLTPDIYDHLYRDITEFRSTFDLPIRDPLSLDSKADTLHSSLIIEELTELAQAASAAEQADAIVDSVYVLMGRQVHLGAANMEDNPAISYLIDLLLNVADNLNIRFLACWDEIHTSNMSKVCHTEQEFEATRAHYASMGIPLLATETELGIVAKCAADTQLDGKMIRAGKVLKSVKYRPADLTALV